MIGTFIALLMILAALSIWYSDIRPWRSAVAMTACCLIGLLAMGCDLFRPETPTIIITNTQTQGGNGSASPTPGTPTACPLPQSVSLGGCGNGVQVGGSCDLSLTPFLAPGVPSPAACDDVRRVEWISTAPGVVLTAGSNKYTPQFKGVSPGIAKVYALVDNVKSAVLDVEVRP